MSAPVFFDAEGTPKESIGPYTLFCPPGQFPPGTDSLRLSGWVSLRPGDRVCDLGCGTGTLGLLLVSRERLLTVDGVDADADACRWARAGIEASGLSGAMRVYEGDLADIRALLPAGGYTLAVCNPPYYESARGGKPRRSPAARTADACPPETVCAAAAWALKNGGRFALCFPAVQLARWMAALRAARLEPKRLHFLTRADKTARLALLEARRGGGPGLVVTVE